MVDHAVDGASAVACEPGHEVHVEVHHALASDGPLVDADRHAGAAERGLELTRSFLRELEQRSDGLLGALGEGRRVRPGYDDGVSGSVGMEV